MKDRELVLELCSRLGLVKYKEDIEHIRYNLLHQNEFIIRSNEIIIGEGDGYGGFMVKFTFDDNGKLVKHGVWE